MSLNISIKNCSICGSDLKNHIKKSPRIKEDQVLGHEISGIIQDISGTYSEFKVGDKVSIGADIACGKCRHCLSGKRCTEDKAFGHEVAGGFAESIEVNFENLTNVPIATFGNDLSFEIASLAEPLACCINGFEKFNSQTFKGGLVILGAGPIGYMLARYGEYLGFEDIILCDFNKYRLNHIKNNSKFHTISLTDEVNPKESISNYLKGNSPDLIFTACSSFDAQKMALDFVGHGSTLNFFGGIPKNLAKDIFISPNYLHYQEITLTGSHGSTPKQHKRALKLLESRKINFDDIITHKFPMNKFNEAIEFSLKGECMKVTLFNE